MRAFVQLFARLLLAERSPSPRRLWQRPATSLARSDRPIRGPAPPPELVAIAAKDLRFTSSTVTAGQHALPVRLPERRRRAHNVAVFRDSSAAERISSARSSAARPPRSRTSRARGGRVLFRCDVHPDMVGTLVVR